MKPIIPNTGKISCTSLVYGLMRLVHRKNNPNKKTLLYIPLPHRNPSVYNPNCKTTHRIVNWYLIIIMSLIWPICLSMCPDLHTYIHIWSRWDVIRNWWGNRRIMFTMGPEHTRDHDPWLFRWLIGSLLSH